MTGQKEIVVPENGPMAKQNGTDYSLTEVISVPPAIHCATEDPHVNALYFSPEML